MKKMSIGLAKRGHIAIFISQVRAKVDIGYSTEPARQTTATGGNALLHFANWILEFQPRFNGDLILTKPDEKPDIVKNPIIGHFAKVVVKKSPNEKTNCVIPYPICYGRTGGKSIWIEKEIVDLMLSWELISKKGGWYSPTEELLELAKTADIELPKSWQGTLAIFKFIEADEKFLNHMVEYFKKIINEI